MLTIGEFSKICKVSPKTLRYYDSIGLFKPVYLDKNNDYRYYSIEQLEDFKIIDKLKEYQFPLVEILNIINKKNDEYLKNLLKQKQEEIKEQIYKSNMLLKKIDEDIKSLNSGNKLYKEKNLKIELINTEPIKILSLRRTIKEKETGELFNELIKLVKKFNIEVYGYPMTIFHDKEYDENNIVDIEMCLPVLKGESKYIRELKGGLCVYTRYVGNYNSAEEVYKALYKWKEKENFEVASPSYQKYIKGIGDTNNPDEYVTDIYLPVRERKGI